MITILCPHCGDEFEGDDSLAGARVECPCGSKFSVPAHVSPVDSADAEVPVQRAPQPRIASRRRQRPTRQQRSHALPITIVLILLIGGCFYFFLRPEPQQKGILAETTQPEATPVEERKHEAGEVAGSVISESGRTLSPGNPVSFSFAEWKSTYGAKIEDMGEWEKRNPGPYTSYFPSSKPDGWKKWYINLGPLGVRTYMHDRTWGEASAVKEFFPKALCDKDGLLFSNFEVIDVKSGSPSEGYLKTGDLILKIDDVPLETATALLLPQKFAGLLVRGLEFHAGQLIDVAEGRGKIKLTVLRLPSGTRDRQVAQPAREWKTLRSQKLTQPFAFSVPMQAGHVGRIDFMTGDKRILGKRLSKNAISCEAKLSNGSGTSIPIDKLQGEFRIPEGNWTLSGRIESSHSGDGKILCTIETTTPAAFPPALSRYLKEIEFPIPQLGSFGSVYSPTGTKALNVNAVMTHRLVAQQLPDGSWPKAKSYSSQSFHTAMCGLALLSTGNPEYNERIKKAAHYVARSSQGKWAYVRGTRLIFLAEYYLRTRDETILPGLRQHVIDARACVFSDYTCGHSVGGPGYGGYGYTGSSSVIACGLALADKGGALGETDRVVLNRMLRRVQSLAAGGVVPYGRTGKHNTEVNEGHRGGCRTGAFVHACLMSGGARHFMNAAVKRYSTAPYGTAENGHATQTLHFFWSSMAIANCGPEAHQNNMSAYLWKFVTYREYDGFANKNNSRTEYHGGDGVIGSPHWRTAAYVILLNAHKRNLAITGAPAYRSTRLQDYPLAFFGDKAFHNHVLRNWALAEAILGGAAPGAFTSTLKTLRDLPDTEELGVQLLELLNREVPTVVRSISSIPRLRQSHRARLLQLVHGIVFESACTVDGVVEEDDEPSARNLSKQEEKAAAKAAEKKFRKDLAKGKVEAQLECSVTIQPISLASRWLKSLDQQGAAYPALEAKGTVICTDSTRQHLKAPVRIDFSTQGPPADASKRERKKLAAEQVKAFKIQMDPGDKGELTLNYNYTINGVPLSYTETLPLPTPVMRGWLPNHCKVWVPGVVAEDYHSGQYCIRVLLRTGEVVACERRNLEIPGDYLLAGTPCQFLISPGSAWGHNLHEVRILNPKYRSARPLQTTVAGSRFTGPPESLTDYDVGKGIAVGDMNADVTVEQAFADPVAVDSVFVSVVTTDLLKKNDFSVDIEAWTNNKWQPIAAIPSLGKGFGRTKRADQLKKIVTATSDRFRFRVKATGAKGLRINELRLHKALSLAQEQKLMSKSTW